MYATTGRVKKKNLNTLQLMKSPSPVAYPIIMVLAATVLEYSYNDIGDHQVSHKDVMWLMKLPCSFDGEDNPTSHHQDDQCGNPPEHQ